MRHRYLSHLLLVAIAYCTALGATSSANDAGDDTEPQLTLVTRRGDRLVGQWLDSAADTQHIVWQADEFASPFEFSQEHLKAVHVRRKPNSQRKPTAVCLCELRSGDLLYGFPVALSNEQLTFNLLDNIDQEVAIPCMC